MLDTLFLVAVGMFIGWNLPQPGYAKAIQAWVMDKIAQFSNKK